MRLKVGDLSKRTGLSVRTLHHYDSLGLLKPSVRSDVGYRLYDAEDIRRLNKIVGLRELGISLDEIRQILEGGMLSTPAVLSAQLARVDAEILRQKKLRLELERLQRALAEDGEPSEAACLHTLEAMAIYRRHLSDDDRNLPLLGSNGRFAAAWQVRLDVLRALFEKGVSARAITARQAATQLDIAARKGYSVECWNVREGGQSAHGAGAQPCQHWLQPGAGRVHLVCFL